MSYEILVKASAKKQLQRIHATDRERILQKIVSLRHAPRPSGSVKLTSQEAYRVRQGNYRIIYTVNGSKLIIEVIRIGHRRDVYEK